jgi:TRAP-type C4-dicarboxylate transport system substrate-binding protein
MRRFLPVVISAVLLACLVAAPRTFAQAAATELKLGSLAPSGSLWHDVLMQMGSTWKKVTAGRIGLKVYPGAQGDEVSLVRKMEIDQYQAASLTVVGLQRIDQAFNAFAIPLFYDSQDELVHVMGKLRPVIEERLAARKFQLLNYGYAGWVQVFSRAPISSLDDLKKQKIYTSAGDDKMVQWYKARGFNPQPLASTDVMLAIQTGLIDAMPVTPLAMVTFQWFKSAPHMLDIPLGPLVGATLVTQRAWNRISEADRAALLQAARQAEDRMALEVPKQDQQSVAEMEKRGLKISRIRGTPQGAAFEAAAREYGQSMRGEWVPTDIYDLAVKERDAFRAQRKSSTR